MLARAALAATLLASALFETQRQPPVGRRCRRRPPPGSMRRAHPLRHPRRRARHVWSCVLTRERASQPASATGESDLPRVADR